MIGKSRIVATLLMACVTTAANATVINSDGFGQIALLPYYNVNNNFITNINVTNTTDLFKAVKVRFHESRLSANVFAVNLYLSPHDVWNGTIRLNPATGVPNFITEDESCTLPEKSQLHAGIDFSNIYDTVTNDDMSEGYVEIIEMGVIADGATGPAADGNRTAEIDATGSADGLITNGDRSVTAGLLHGPDSLPADCSVVQDAWNAGSVDTNINGFESGGLSSEGIATSGATDDPYDSTLNAGLVYEAADRGGINAYTIIINVVDGAAFVIQGTHIDDYATLPQHYRPDDVFSHHLPSLASGDVTEAYMLDNNRGVKSTGPLSLTEWDTGAVNEIAANPFTPLGSNPFPVAVTLSTDAISAPFFTKPLIDGGSEIVVTFPMRKHGIYNGSILTDQVDVNAADCYGDINDGIDDGAAATIPNTEITAQDYPVIAGVFCANAGFTQSTPDVRITLHYYNYEEQYDFATGAHDFLLPTQPDPFFLERGVNVVNISRPDWTSATVLGPSGYNVFTLGLNEGFYAGWVKIVMSDYDYNTDARISNLTEAVGGINDHGMGYWTGVPVIGFSAMAADIGPAKAGETVDLIRFVNRNSPTPISQ
ncbi:MAG: hypothetical protein MI756_16920 [Chromatiales bacterium]|nr:hypothetical protein [Chromatiales bacterium]